MDDTVVVYWYDRHTRSWVVQRKDKSDNQIGDAYYTASKHDAQAVAKSWWAHDVLQAMKERKVA